MPWFHPKPDSPTDKLVRDYLDCAENLPDNAWTDSAPHHIVCRLPEGNFLHLELLNPKHLTTSPAATLPTLKLSASPVKGQTPTPPLETVNPRLLIRAEALLTQIQKDIDFATSPQIRGGRLL